LDDDAVGDVAGDLVVQPVVAIREVVLALGHGAKATRGEYAGLPYR
jgi:hypothetical protein